MCMVLLIGSVDSASADWPTYRGDAQRSGATDQQLTLPLNEAWRFTPTHPPRPAWPPPAERDWHPKRQGKGEYANLLDFDHVFQPVAHAGRVYFGSSSEHTVTCIDGKTGELQWRFFTEGPVRMAPTVAGGNLLFGSDDGHVYCVDAASGALQWKYRAGPRDARLPGNEQMISRWPVRSGVLVRDGVAYAAAGVFPQRLGAFLAAIDARTGRELWKRTLNQVTQGYLLIVDGANTEPKLVVAGGEGLAQSYALDDGRPLGQVAGPRGAIGTAIGDKLAWGPGMYGNEFALVSTADVTRKYSQIEALRVTASPTQLFGVTRDKQLFALQRKWLDRECLAARKTGLEQRLRTLESIVSTPERPQDQVREAKSEIAEIQRELPELEKSLAAAGPASEEAGGWRKTCEQTSALIRAGSALVAGGNGEVMAYRISDGKAMWRGRVDGEAKGLAVADGRLYVATTTGALYCFASGTARTAPQAAAAEPRADTHETGSSSNAVFAAAADFVGDTVRADRGYCLDIGCGDGRLAQAIAERTDLFVIGVEPDSTTADAARRRLQAAGLYGTRVVIHEAAPDRLPYPSYVFNAIVSANTLTNGELPVNGAELLRVLRPCGGTLCLGQPAAARTNGLTQEKLDAWCQSAKMPGRVIDGPAGIFAHYERPRLPGAGQWTHQYADAANTGCSDDGALRRPLTLQWFGRPGPRVMYSRHAYSHSPLYRYGRLFTLTGYNEGREECHVICQDAYNGTVLWKTRLGLLKPRINIPRDSGYMAVDDEYLYVAASKKAYRLRVKTGKIMQSVFLPEHDPQALHQWGYLAVDDNTLFGSGVLVGRFYRHGFSAWHDKVVAKVCSDFLCAFDAETRDLKWKYDGVVINSSITAGGGGIYFVENRQKEVVNGTDRITSEIGELFVVALDADNGKKMWEQSVTFETEADVLFGQYAAGRFVLARCRKAGRHNAYQDLRVYDAASGKTVWQKLVHGGVGHHASHRRKMLIVGNILFQDPNAYDLNTGEQKWTMFYRRDCSNMSASADYLFGRHQHHHLISIDDLERGAVEAATEPLTSVTRPSCWISSISGGGLVLAPEASAGCVCYFPIHASMAFAGSDQPDDNGPLGRFRPEERPESPDAEDE
jgi:outer membrane protein assembly factor BamB